MPAKRKPESCLFCGCTPCECEPKKKSRSTPKKHSEPPIAQPVSDIDFGPVQGESRFKAKEQAERDLSFMNALRSIRDIVSDRDKRWLDSQLNPPYSQELDRRVSEWRAKNGWMAKGKAPPDGT